MAKKGTRQQDRGVTVGRVEVEFGKRFDKSLEASLQQMFENEIKAISKGHDPSLDPGEFGQVIAQLIFEGKGDSHIAENVTAIEQRIKELDEAIRVARLHQRGRADRQDEDGVASDLERLKCDRNQARQELIAAQDAAEEQRRRLIEYAENVLGKAGKQ